MSEPDSVAEAALTVIRPGPSVTVQDLGRVGYRSKGVPSGGAFDRSAHELANALAGNGSEAATLELTLFGGLFRAEVPLAVALSGAPMPATRRRPGGTDLVFHPPVGFGLEPGDLLDVGGASSGVRSYLAVRRGWQTPRILGSRSSEQPLRAGDQLPAFPSASPVRRVDRTLLHEADSDSPIRIVDGPDVGWIKDPSWLHQRFIVARDSNRMGIRLEGPSIAVTDSSDRLSLPVAPGALQIAGGQPIILGVACGTMGGYPLVAHVASCDLDRLAQARPGQHLHFKRIDATEARRLDREARARQRADRIRILTLISQGPVGLSGQNRG